jgi:hypothetical protein
VGEDPAPGEATPAALNPAIPGSHLAPIKPPTEPLGTSSPAHTHKLSDPAAAADREAGGGGTSSQPSDDDVVDAEIIDDVDDEQSA